MNFQKLETEILRGVRGSLSQQRLSTKMGFAFNKVYRWECGLLRDLSLCVFVLSRGQYC